MYLQYLKSVNMSMKLMQQTEQTISPQNWSQNNKIKLTIDTISKITRATQSCRT